MCNRFALLASALCAVFPGVACAGTEPFGPLWQRGTSAIVVVPCPPGGDTDETCRAIAVRDHGRTQLLGQGYMAVRLLWSARSRAATPDLLVLGDDGGSGGDGDLFAVTFAPRLQVRKLQGERMDWAAVHSGSRSLRLDVAFDIEFFNGASHAGATIVRLPVRWVDGNFSLDLAALTARSFSPDELDFRALAIDSEFRQWVEDRYPAPALYPPEAPSGTPVAVQALAEMMLSGHADQARELLHRSWPSADGDLRTKRGGEDRFWTALCQAIARHPLWKRFDLSRLPHADLIEAGAAGARPE